MAEMWKPKDPEVYKAWLALIDDQAEDLTPWESRFIDDIRMKILNGWTLLEGQAEKLEEIYAEHTS